MSKVKPYWYPVLCDTTWAAQCRIDYPDKSEMSDEELRDYFNDGLKYERLWDHIGDAYEDFEPLADAYLALEADNERLTDAYQALYEEAYSWITEGADPRVQLLDAMHRKAIKELK